MAGLVALAVRWAAEQLGLAPPRPSVFRFAPTAEEKARLRRQFAEHGYVHLKQLLSPEQVAGVATAVAEVRARLHTLPRHHQFYDVIGNPESLKQLQDLHAYHEVFASLAGDRAMEVLAEALLGEPAVLRNIQYFNKPPLTSKPTPPHQDGYYFMITPQSAVTMWLALDKADEENGCLVYVKGSGGGPIRPHQPSGILGFSQKCTDYGTPNDLANEIVMAADPGDMVAHNSVMLHRTGANTSTTRQRRAIGLVYYGVSAKTDHARSEAYQKSLRDALAAAGKI